MRALLLPLLLVFVFVQQATSQGAAAAGSLPTVEVDATGKFPNALDEVTESAVYMKKDHPGVWSLHNPDGTKLIAAFLKEKGEADSSITDLERHAELVVFLYEVAEWGSKGPPGGFSIGDVSVQPKRIVPPTRRKRNLIEELTSRLRRTPKEDEIGVTGHFRFVPKPGSRAEQLAKEIAANPDAY